MVATLHAHARAQGKVILLGEHAVVHGYPAVAAGLPGAVELTTQHDRPGQPHRLVVPAWDVDIEVTPDSDNPVARAAHEVLAHADGPVTGSTITGRSALPARAGLGSSAALSVALARLALGPEGAEDAVVAASLAGERVFHGTPSGVDSLVAARGGVVLFRREEPAKPVHLRDPLVLLVVPSGIPRQTADQVAKVRRALDVHPDATRSTLDAIGAVTKSSVDAIEHSDFTRLGELMAMGHGLLHALGVSCPELDHICATLEAGGARGAKLTGAGGGGCAIALAPAMAERAPLLAALEARGTPGFVVEIQPS